MLQKEPIILHLSIYAAKVHIFLHICKNVPSNSVYFCIFFVLDFFSDRFLSLSVYKRKALYIFHFVLGKDDFSIALSFGIVFAPFT